MAENQNENQITPAPVRPEKKKDRVTAAVFAFLLGWSGMHKYYLGYGSVGVIYLLVFILSVFLIFSFFFTLIGAFTIYLPFIFSIVDGVLYLSKSDEEFQRIYVEGRREWF